MQAVRLEVERILRVVTKTAKGTMRIRRLHVNKVLRSNKSARIIGKPRADIVWACVAYLVTTGGHVNKDMSNLGKMESAMLQLKGRSAMGLASPGSAHRLEMVGSVKAWLTENEECSTQGVHVLRMGKLNQLKAARKKTAETRGGPRAIVAALALLSAEGVATMRQAPRLPARGGPWNQWIPDSMRWMVIEGWISESEEADLVRKAEKTYEEHAKNEEPSILALNLGEGWRSVGEAITELYPGSRTVGVDRRGFTWTGYEKGLITSELCHDWTQQSTKSGSDLITALSRKASVSVQAWDAALLEPECTLLSTANSMNQSNGSAHGQWAFTELNMANSSVERQEEERRMYEEAKLGIKTQLDSLERHPDLPFSLENPRDSEFWDLDFVVAAIERNEDWVVRLIDRCAYGRREQKPTKILTNRKAWIPRGRTGNGRCQAGKCTGKKTRSGRTEHPGQTIPNDRARDLDMGGKKKGRRERSRKAVKNALEPELVKEILDAIRR